MAWPRGFGRCERGPVARDAVPAVLLVAVGWFGIAMQLVHGPYYGTTGRLLALASAILWAAEHGPIALRRRAPRAALGITVGAYVGGMAFAGFLGRQGIPPAIALAVISYSLLAHLGRRQALPALSLAALVLLGGVPARALAGLPLQMTEVLATLVLAVLVPALLGEVVCTRRAYTAALEERARRLEQERRTRDEQAAREERLRISRELHDAVTHHLTGMVVEAGAAERRARSDPEAAVAALASLRAQGRVALASLRQLVGVLRDASDPTLATGQDPVGAPSAPHPSLAQLDELVDSSRAAGIEVEVAVHGKCHPLPDAVDLAAYRILQESLTNVHRHSASPRVNVTVTYGPESVDLQVSNAVSATTRPAPGHGLIGSANASSSRAGEAGEGCRQWLLGRARRPAAAR